jgi:hypothetical protein
MLHCPCSKKRYPLAGSGPAFTRMITDQCHGETRGYVKTMPWEPLHWGQLKLLISEIEFLTPFYGDVFNVVYAGDAPGVHNILANMFPSMRFILVDPAPRMIADGDYLNIDVIQDFMTDNLSRDFLGYLGTGSYISESVRKTVTNLLPFNKQESTEIWWVAGDHESSIKHAQVSFAVRYQRHNNLPRWIHFIP